MRYLLDTHVLMWFLGEDPKLPQRIRDVIENSDDINVSIASFWEMAIKESKKKLSLNNSITEIMKMCREDLNFSIIYS